MSLTTSDNPDECGLTTSVRGRVLLSVILVNADVPESPTKEDPAPALTPLGAIRESWRHPQSDQAGVAYDGLAGSHRHQDRNRGAGQRQPLGEYAGSIDHQ